VEYSVSRARRGRERVPADKKIAELINQLFPGGAGARAVTPGTTVVQ